MGLMIGTHLPTDFFLAKNNWRKLISISESTKESPPRIAFICQEEKGECVTIMIGDKRIISSHIGFFIVNLNISNLRISHVPKTRFPRLFVSYILFLFICCSQRRDNT